MLYRRHTESPVWHFCQNCTAWPMADYQEQTMEPPRETLCSECKARNQRLECEVVPQPGAA